MTRRIPVLVAIVAAGFFLLGSPARAQWTSAYHYINLAADFNGYETLNPNMQLVSNGVWQAYVTFQNHTNDKAFLFATRNFTNVWKLSSQGNFNVPLSGTLITDGSGNDVVIKNFANGTLKFTLNESTKQFSVVDVTAGSVYSDIWINELHYDDPGTDTNEFIEVAGAAGTALSAYKLILYNGSNGKKYNELALSGTIPNQAGGFGAVHFTYGKDGIQNGSPDGIALVKNNTNVLSFISYEDTLTATDGPAQGMTSVDIGVQENNSGQPETSLQLAGTGAAYGDFTWIGPTNWSRGQLNVGQTIQAGTPAANLALSNLVTIPAIPTSDDAVHVSVGFSTNNSISNIVLTTFYRVNEVGRFLPLPMTVVSGTTYRTSSPIPAQDGGSTVEYYIFARFNGAGTNSPIVYPATAPSNAPSYRISSVQGGSVWVNEIHPVALLEEPPREYIEIAGVAGSDISKWTVEIHQSDDGIPSYVYQIPNGTVLGNEGQGFGFYVLGNESLPADLTWPDESEHLSTPGAIRLLNEFGDLVDALQWGPSSWNGFTYLGNSYNDVEGANTLGLSGTGGTASAFTWTDVYGPTPGVRNTNQVFTGGNTNVLPPMISCPSNIYLSCLSDPVPAPNPSLVTASSMCGGGVVVTWVSDVTNGVGCAGNPRIITRTYRAVATNCAKTNTCQQLIITEDNTPPVINCDTTILVNAGFEFGDFTGWQTYGGAATNITIESFQPHSGFRHARVRGSSVSEMLDESGNEMSGFYIGNPVRRQAGAKANTGYSVRFNGTNQYAEVPNNSLLNPDSFSFAFWVKPLQSNNATRALLSSRQFTISEVSGYHVQLTTSNKLEFWTANGWQWDILGGPALSTNWTFVAGTFDYSAPPVATKRIWINGVQVTNRVVTNFMANSTQPLRIAAGATETAPADFFGGFMDDVRIFAEDIGSSGVSALYNSGNGRATALGSETAYYRLDDAAATNAESFSGLRQSLPAGTGQTWAASAWVLIPSGDALAGSNKVYVKLDYLNATNAVLATYTSQVLTADTPAGSYYRLIARGTSPANTKSARISTVFQQDAAGSPGSAYIDDAVLSTLLLVASNSCPVMPNLLGTFSATDSCSTNLIYSQYPTAGTQLTATNTFVRLFATDACGNTAYCEREMTILDDILPTIICPSNLAVDCIGSVPQPQPDLVVATDNCGPATVSFVRDTISGGTGCGTNPIYVVREYRATDSAGNATNCLQLITVLATNPPVVTYTLPTPLQNLGFEDFLSFYRWTKFGTTLSTPNTAPHSGSKHAYIWGPGGAGDHYVGFYQDMQATPGQRFRGSAWVQFPSSPVMAASNSLEMKIEFLSPFGLLTSHPILITTTNLPSGSYKQFGVSGIAPTGATIARLTFVYLQRGNATGAVYVDDAKLSLTELSVTNNGCTTTLPDYTPFASAIGCDIGSVSQSPAPGSTVGLGVTPVTLTAYNQCGTPGSVVLNVTAISDGCTGGTPPGPSEVDVVGMSMGPGGLTVRSLGTNTWSVQAQYTTNLAANPQNWLPISTSSNTFLNGTNITSFQIPVTGNTPVIYRILQKYP